MVIKYWGTGGVSKTKQATFTGETEENENIRGRRKRETPRSGWGPKRGEATEVLNRGFLYSAQQKLNSG